MRGFGAALASPVRRAWRATFGTRRSLSIVVTLTIVAFAVGFASNYWLPQRLGYTLLFGIALAGFWTWSAGQGVRVRMSRSRDRVQAGESIIERFEVINDSVFPKLWLEVEETSDLPKPHGAICHVAGSRGSPQLACADGVSPTRVVQPGSDYGAQLRPVRHLSS